jgi:adenosyl cobinamide kinase/adenosyl cobinamide phosphate guanylyltransferase
MKHAENGCSVPLHTLVTGLKGSGKSEFAERLLDRFSYNYFATLETKPANQDRINKHKKRRDFGTVVYEATACVPKDLAAIREFLSTEHGLLLDGLTVYLLRLNRSVSGNKNVWLKLSAEFIDNLCTLLASSHHEWVMVDICKHGLKNFGSSIISVNERAHEQLAGIAGTKHVRFCAECDWESAYDR